VRVSSPRSRRGDTITASEVGRYAYCARSWWLQRVGGHAPQNLRALEEGRRRHGEHGRRVRAMGRQAVWARRLALAAALLAIALLVSLRWSW